MTAMPTSSPIAEVRGGRLMTPWLKWFADLQASISGDSGGTISVVDSTARAEAADAVGDAAVLAARVATMEKRIADLEAVALGVVR